MKTNIKQTSFDSIGYALYAFGGLGLELVVMMIEASLYGMEVHAWNDLQHILHWLVTCIIWGSIGMYLLRKLSAIHQPIQRKQLGGIILCVIISILFTTILHGGLKPLQEYEKLGLLLWIIQDIYYAFEVLLIVLIIAHSTCAIQKLQETHHLIPFGGITLALTWGLIHILTQGMMTGMYTVVLSILFGFVYLLSNKSFKVSYIAITVMFMI